MGASESAAESSRSEDESPSAPAAAYFGHAPTHRSATLVYLASKSGFAHVNCLGGYRRSEQMSGFRHVYENEDNKTSLWYLPAPTTIESDRVPGTWWVGPSDMVGTRGGYLKATENTDVPEEITAIWHEIGDDGVLHPAPDLSIFLADAHETLMRDHLATAAPSVKLSGLGPNGKPVALQFPFGKFIRSETPEGQERAVYRNEGKGADVDDPERAVWYVNGYWCVGEASDCGSQTAYMMVQDDCLLPENISAVWKIYLKEWKDAPGMKVVV